MRFNICDSENKSIMSGILVTMRPHLTVSENTGQQCFLVYMNEVIIHNEEKFNDWKTKCLKRNAAHASNGIKANSEYCYIVFTLDGFYEEYDFLIKN